MNCILLCFRWISMEKKEQSGILTQKKLSSGGQEWSQRLTHLGRNLRVGAWNRIQQEDHPLWRKEPVEIPGLLKNPANELLWWRTMGPFKISEKTLIICKTCVEDLLHERAGNLEWAKHTGASGHGPKCSDPFCLILVNIFYLLLHR